MLAALPMRGPASGGPIVLRPADTVRFWSHVNRRGPDECWPWRRATDREGYGRFSLAGELETAHRVAYTIAFGPIPPGLLACHDCDNPPCCNPAHLFAGTNADNAKDRSRKGRGVSGMASKTECPHGHQLSGDNVMWRVWRGYRYRACRTCVRARNAAAYQRRKLAAASTRGR